MACQTPGASSAAQEGGRSWDSHHHPRAASELAEFLRHRREHTTPGERRAAGRRPPPHAGPAPRGGLAARRGRRCPGTRGSSRAATSRRRRACSTRSPACSASTPPSAPTSSTSPASRVAASADPYPAEAPAELREIVHGLAPEPGLSARAAHATCWSGTRAATTLLGEPSRAPDGVPNMLWWMFTDPGAARDLLGGHRPRRRSPASAPSTPAATTTRASAALIEALLEASPRVPRALAAPRGPRRPARDEGRRPSRSSGRLAFLHLQSIPTSHPDLRLTQFVPVDAATRAALEAAHTSDEWTR